MDTIKLSAHKFVVLCGIVLTVLFGFGCNEDDVDTPLQAEPIEIAGDDNFSTYYIDDVEVDSKVFNGESSDMFVVDVYGTDNNIKQTSADRNEELQDMVEKRAYSSAEKYIEFGESVGLNFKALLKFERIMSEYAEKKGVTNGEIETVEEVPGWYSEYEKSVYDSLFYAGKELQMQRKANLFISFYRDPNRGGGHLPMLASYAFMPPSWNNVVSSIQFVGLGGGIVIYDKAFYRKRLKTIVGISMTAINLGYGVNDKMSSAVRIL